MRCAGIIVAGGKGHRFGGEPKQLRLLRGQPLLVHAAWALRRAPGIEALVVVLPADLVERCEALLGEHGLGECVVCAGGAERVDSVAAGLAAAPASCDGVAVHDAARPLLEAQLVARLIAAADADGAAIPALRAHDTVKLAGAQDERASVEQTLDRERVWLAQTPQVFRRELLERAFAEWRSAGQPPVTDDAMLCELAGIPVTLVEGDPKNFKVTLPADLAQAERELANAQPPSAPRSGIGYDVHRLVSGRPLILGGVTIPHERGLDGHSDADVLAHAIGDALLGAAALGDLGRHFPPSDARWKGADSLVLLGSIVSLLAEQGLRPISVDSVVICETPKLAPHIAAMRTRLAAALGLTIERVAVKATTSEGLGFTGRGEGIAAQAMVLVQ
jgi:2-C-methyl-D-erythritol 4-phosphate cytidylyltransferase/2-C-methyl-D-erythritol 2,4-cyclodiphosphate synthase